MKKLILDRSKCAGCGFCHSSCPKLFELKEDGKSHIIGSKLREDGKEELELKEEDLECAQSAVDICPMKIIEIEED